MKEKPILFNGDMVRAILSGNKTQTRRVIKDTGFYAIDERFHGEDVVNREVEAIVNTCKFGKVGDQLWVRETFIDLLGTGIDGNTPHSNRYAYREATPSGSYGDECRKDYGLKWNPSIFMPRAASRIQLEITGIRVERLNDISEEDAIREGAESLIADNVTEQDKALLDLPLYDIGNPYRNGYALLWESINGAGSWAANPYVWVVEFKVIKP
jgi:hypothetical protein